VQSKETKAQNIFLYAPQAKSARDWSEATCGRRIPRLLTAFRRRQNKEQKAAM